MKVEITFEGGPQNGTMEIDAIPGHIPPNATPSENMAHSFYFLSGGQVGKGTTGATPAAYALLMMGDKRALDNLKEKSMTYIVKERREEAGKIYITAIYTKHPLRGRFGKAQPFIPYYGDPPDPPISHGTGIGPLWCEVYSAAGVMLARLPLTPEGKWSGRAVESGTASSYEIKDGSGKLLEKGTVKTDGTGDLNFSDNVIVKDGIVAIWQDKRNE